MILRRIYTALIAIMLCSTSFAQHLHSKQQAIISISALAAKGDLVQLKHSLNKGLEVGLTINEIKEVFVHLYAYCGFPRSIRGLQTFMSVLDERKAKGLTDVKGAEASPIHNDTSKYERGKKVLGELTKAPQQSPLTGYSAFAPVEYENDFTSSSNAVGSFHFRLNTKFSNQNSQPI